MTERTEAAAGRHEILCPFASDGSHFASRSSSGGFLCHLCDLNLDAEEFELRRQSQQCPATFTGAVDLLELLSLKFPPRRWVVPGLLQELDIGMVHSFRGVGKTRFLHQAAYATVSGAGFLRYAAAQPRGVLLVDGELPREDLQMRFLELVKISDAEPVAPLKVLAADLLDEPLPSLSTRAGQARVEADLEGVSVLILDSLSTLCWTEAGENEAASWDEMQSWLLSLRRYGKTVLFAHHDGKGGSQRGTSKREDILSQVVQLVRPSDYHPREGCRFEVHLRKARAVYGEDAEPFEAALWTDENGESVWTWRSLEDPKKSRVRIAYQEGLTTIRAIAKDTGISKSTVQRKLKELRDEGLIS